VDLDCLRLLGLVESLRLRGRECTSGYRQVLWRPPLWVETWQLAICLALVG
jgi:hypothetical protein